MEREVSLATIIPARFRAHLHYMTMILWDSGKERTSRAEPSHTTTLLPPTAGIFASRQVLSWHLGAEKGPAMSRLVLRVRRKK